MTAEENAEGQQSATKTEMVLWGLKHPKKGILVLIAATMATVIVDDVDRGRTLYNVRSGLTTTDHRIAEGIGVIKVVDT